TYVLGALNVVDVARSVLGVAKEAAPGPSKNVLGGVAAAWDVAERVRGTRERAHDLASCTKGLRDKMIPLGPDGAGITADVQQFLETSEVNNQQMEPILQRSWIAGLVNLNRDEKKVGDASHRIDQEVHDVQEIITQVQVTHMQIQVIKLGKVVEELRFLMIQPTVEMTDASSTTSRTVCLAQRKWIEGEANG
ncbi:hypothetical protein H0H92_008747, partial [Tricholoma furcatifolium]